MERRNFRKALKIMDAKVDALPRRHRISVNDGDANLGVTPQTTVADLADAAVPHRSGTRDATSDDFSLVLERFYANESEPKAYNNYCHFLEDTLRKCEPSRMKLCRNVGLPVSWVSITTMLEIKELRANVGEREILKGLSLSVKPGEVHAIMGPNGSGKSTLAQIIAGKSDYNVISGDILFEGESLMELEPDERACNGIFLAFQYPVEIPGVSNTYFLRAALNAIRKYRGEKELESAEFLRFIREKIKLLELDGDLLTRSVNEGFSGGEKKRNEIFQMAVLEPKLCVLDETDSGLDIDALKTVANGVNALRSPERSFVVVTHYQRLLNYIVPDFVHILVEGKIVRSGTRELALELEEKGYGWLESEVAANA